MPFECGRTYVPIPSLLIYHARFVSIPTFDGAACALSACLRKIQNTIDDHLSTIPHVQLEAPPPRDYFIIRGRFYLGLYRTILHYSLLLGVGFCNTSYKLISLSSVPPSLLLLLLITASFTYLALIFV